MPTATEEQITLLTEAIKAIRTGQWSGPGSLDAIYCALKGGLAAPDYQPIWPAPVPATGPDWATIILQTIGAPLGEAQYRILDAWAACEGTLPLGSNNPLDVEAPRGELDYWPGSIADFNADGVITFDTVENGARACGLNLKNGPQYAGLVAALKAGDIAAWANDPGLDTWGTGRACPKAKLGV